ncbi:hypothetical protein LNKW23_44790 [Paralimibaculum aggregatum]|uniref:Lipoprotein n=1 Tax=Paralimibaculum aggregatum TaxID=3036245 RepID=A0ABQ6LT65_9RHOB|nr:hypothetical protein [Limibaculum sp. NKW23]GMG85261.1 hypothetical protein LNKW23_44790 [Limibaculum sp. NKW23]
MRQYASLAALIALAVSACGPEQPNIRTGEGMVDPATGALDPVFIDGTFSLSAIIEERIGQPLQNSDRREIDAATDAALAAPQGAPPVIWRNDLRKNEGFVDLVSWRVDTRAGELCGVIEHEELFGKPLRGAVTICRASIDPAWRVDEVVWAEKVAVYTPPKTGYKPKQPPKTYKPQPPVTYTPTPQPPYTPKPQPPTTYTPNPQPPVNYGPGTGSGVTSAPSGGAQTLGDALASPVN